MHLGYHEPMGKPVDPCTPETIAAAKAAAEQERAPARALGLVIDSATGLAKLLPQGAPRLVKMPVKADRPLPERLDCAEAIDNAVEAFGLEAVIRCVRSIAAMNGRELA